MPDIFNSIDILLMEMAGLAYNSFLSMLSLNILLVVLFYLFPVVKRFVFLIGFPFRILHQFIHLQVIVPKKHDISLTTVNLKSMMQLNTPTTSLYTICKVALAPLLLGIPVSVCFLSVKMELHSLEELLVYYYLYLIIAGTLWPDDNDYALIYEAILMRTAISFKNYLVLVSLSSICIVAVYYLSHSFITAAIVMISLVIIIAWVRVNKRRDSRINFYTNDIPGSFANNRLLQNNRLE